MRWRAWAAPVFVAGVGVNLIAVEPCPDGGEEPENHFRRLGLPRAGLAAHEDRLVDSPLLGLVLGLGVRHGVVGVVGDGVRVRSQRHREVGVRHTRGALALVLANERGGVELPSKRACESGGEAVIATAAVTPRSEHGP